MTYLYIGNNAELLVDAISERIKEDIQFQGGLLDDEFMVPDIHILRSKDNESIGIDSVRNFTKALQRKPFKEAKQFGIILNFERATIEAQNILLKELEDHPDTNVYILAATEETGILPTIRSRSTIKFVESEITKEENEELKTLSSKFLNKKLDLIDVYSETENRDWNRTLAEQFMYELYSLALPKFGQNKKVLRLFQQSSEFLKSNVSVKHIVFYLLISLRNEI